MIELLQFRHSPYNEKVRWALDLKAVPHRRRSLLPGPHMAVVKRLTGHTQTPVLVTESGEAIAGSARILDWLEQRYPTPRLMPDAAAAREKILRLQQRFDEDLTPRIRCVVIDALLRRPGYFARVFGAAEPPWKRRLYALVVPLAAPLVRKGNGITGREAIADGIAAGHEALYLVAEQSRATGYLAGDGFSLADGGAAAGRSRVRGTDRALPRASGRAMGARDLRPAPSRQRRL